MDIIIGNKGLDHISQTIFCQLDFHTVKQCRLVCKIWTSTIDEGKHWWFLQLEFLLSKYQKIQNPEWTSIVNHFQCSNNFHPIQKLLYPLKEYLIEVTEKDDRHDSILHWAVRNDKISAFEALISTNYDFNVTDIYGRTPLHWACRMKNEEITQFMLNHSKEKEINVNADADIRGMTPIHWACKHGNCDIVKIMLNCDSINVNARDQAGQTPLFAAIGEGKLDILELLNHHESIDFKSTDDLGMTPLHWACFYHYANVDPKVYEDIVRFLIKIGDSKKIKISATDLKGRTPKDLATLRGYHTISNIFQ